MITGTTYNDNGNTIGQWTAPFNIIGPSVIELWGAGGGGGGGDAVNPAGSGGGSGGYVKHNLTITAGTIVHYTVGVGGTGGAAGSQGQNGTATTCVTYSLTANGGYGGAGSGSNTGTIGSGGSASGGNDTNTTGGSGSNQSGTSGGAGGDTPSPFESNGSGGASSTGNGNHAVGFGAGGGGGGQLVPNSTGGYGMWGIFALTYSYFEFYAEVGSGGSTTGGLAVNYVISSKRTTGGSSVGGISKLRKITTNVGSGGVKTGGISPAYFKYNFTASGGMISGGQVTTKIIILARGGMKAGGHAIQNSIHHNVASGGVKVGGHAPQKRFFSTKASGGITVTGNFAGGVTARKYRSTGGFTVGGNAITNTKFFVNLTMLWNVRQRVRVDTTFLWNTGNSVNYWYRIIAKDKCSHDPCCQRYILNVHAISQSDLCAKLTKRGYNFTIESVQQFTVPADTAVAAVTPNPGNCNTFVPIPICNIPLCAEFCVSYDEVIEATADMTVQINAFFNYTAVNGVYITGSAGCSFNRMIPDFPYVAHGGITMGGSADCISEGYAFTSNGVGITMGGTAGIRSSAWNYIGGQWPSKTLDETGLTTQSIPELDTDRAWSLTDRVLIEDGSFSSVDISYSRTSQFLVVEGFNFNIPDNSTILQILVTVRRKSNQLGVRDVEAYIFNGNDEIISSNKALTAIDWPYMIESATVYDFTDQFDLTEINAGFGFALRVKATIPIVSTIAMVDVITVQVIYEATAGQKIVIGGEAGIKSTAFSWFANTTPSQFGGNAVCRKGVRYNSSGVGITIGGHYQFGLNYEADGGVEIGGNADCRPSFQAEVGTGGATTGGIADVKPYYEYGSGGFTTSGSARTACRYHIVASGGIKTQGFAISTPKAYHYVASGGFSIIGTADRRTNSWNYISDGNVVFVQGNADCRSSNLGDVIQQIEFDMTVDNMLVKFNEYENTNDAKNLSELLARCGCLDLPLMLNLSQVIAQNNNFAQFLNRNKLTISNKIKMQYNVPNDSWQTNLYYKGLSPDANSYETWNVMFDMQCTQNLGAIFIGRQIWRFSTEVVRKNLTSGVSFTTRLVIGILPDNLCAANELNFTIQVNTQTLATQVSPNATIYQSLIYDEIGMFKNNAWISNPNLVFTISQVGLTPVQQRIDLTTQIAPVLPALFITAPGPVPVIQTQPTITVLN